MRIHQRYRHGNSASTVCSMIDCQINQWWERRSKLKQKHFSPPRKSSFRWNRKTHQTKGLLHRLIANPTLATHSQVDRWMDVSIWSISDRDSLFLSVEEEKENEKPSMKIRRELLEQPRGTRNLCSRPLIDGFEQNFFFSSVPFLHLTSKSNIKEYVSKERHSHFNEEQIFANSSFRTDVSLSRRRFVVIISGKNHSVLGQQTHQWVVNLTSICWGMKFVSNEDIRCMRNHLFKRLSGGEGDGVHLNNGQCEEFGENQCLHCKRVDSQTKQS